MDILRSGVAFSEAATVLTPDFINLVNTNVQPNVSNTVLQNYILPAYATSGSGGTESQQRIYHRWHDCRSNCTGSYSDHAR